MSLILDGTNGLSDVDGSAATPAIRGSDANTGVFFGADIIGFSEGGTECARFNADAQFVAAAGTASLPVITTTGDVNTGIFFPAADTIAFAEGGAEAMRIDSSGNLLVGGTAQSGTANRTAVFSANKFGLSVIDTTAQAAGVGGALNLGGNYRSTGDAQAFCRVAAAKENSTDANFAYAMTFATTPDGGTFTERARIDSSGNLLVGTTTTGAYQDGRLNVISTSSSPSACFKSILSTQATMFVWNSADSGTRKFAGFVVSGSPSEVGTITSTGSSTAYNTNSDYRLKHDIQPMTGALAKVAALKPCTYKWKVDGSDGQGFIAHELAEVEPGCVSGEKDAVDVEGNPQYQGIDTSFLVATLAAALQEAHGLIKDLQARVDALEAK